MPKFDPEPGHWYEDIEAGQIFCVTAVDTAGKSVEICSLDGEKTEVFELSHWYALPLIQIDEPDGTGGDAADDLDLDLDDDPSADADALGVSLDGWDPEE